MEVGCLRHPGALTIGSKLLDGDRSHGWQIQATQPSAPTREEKKQAQGTLITQRKEKGGTGETASKEYAPRLGETLTLETLTETPSKRYNALWTKSHSRPQSLRSFWPMVGIESSGLVQHRKSAIHGLPVKSSKSDWLTMRNEYSAHAQKIWSGQSTRSQRQARRIVGSVDENDQEHKESWRMRIYNKPLTALVKLVPLHVVVY